jgi:hypothetical protein
MQALRWEPDAATELRIVAKPQRWLWWLNLFLQPALAGLMFYAASSGDGSAGSRVFLAVLGLLCLALWGFGVSVILRLRGGPLYVVVGERHLEVPSMVRRTTVVVPYAEIEKASLQEIHAGGVSFFQLAVGYRSGGKKKSVVIAQQLVGREALEQVVEALVSRGVQV